MAKARRLERLQVLILRTIATTIQRDIRDPRVGIVSITHVKLDVRSWLRSINATFRSRTLKKSWGSFRNTI